MPTYLGFSTYNRVRNFKLTDFELIRQDLFNHFHIKQGEKLMNPSFGTIIWNLLFEPFSETVRNAIADDVKRIVAYDPRVEAENVIITEFTTGIQIELELRYVLTNQVTTLALNFDRDSQQLTTS
jgi:phage baseplate assembly protein W